MEARDALRMWVGGGHIDAELASRLDDILDQVEKPNRSAKLIGLLVTVGAILVGGGLLLFIASHWDEQSPLRRLLLIYSSYVVIVAAAWLAGRQRLQTTARGLWLLSTLAVGVGIFLAGQIFNLPLNYWQGTLLWMIAAMVMGWAESSEAQGWVVVTLALLTIGWSSVPDSRFFDQAAFLFDEAGIRSLLPLMGLALVATSELVSKSEFGFLRRPALSIGVTLIAVPLTVSTFHPEAFSTLFELESRWFHAVVIAGCVAAIAATWRLHKSGPAARYAFVAVAVLMVIALPQVDSGSGSSSRSGDSGTVSWLAEPFFDSAVLFGIYTAIIFGLALGAAALGQRLGIAALVNGGIAVIAVISGGVYIGRLAGTLPTSIAVLVGGVVLIGGAVLLERARRDLISEVVQ